MSSSKFSQYADGKIHEVECARPDSFRAGLYLFARRRNTDAVPFAAVSYIRWDSPTRHPVVMFALGETPLPVLPGAPSRGAHSHRAES